MDVYTVAAIGLVAIAALYALWPRSKKGLSLSPSRPGRALIDAMEEAGKDGAGLAVERVLGAQKAKEVQRSLAEAFATDAPRPNV